jgi:hypothetical protein
VSVSKKEDTTPVKNQDTIKKFNSPQIGSSSKDVSMNPSNSKEEGPGIRKDTTESIVEEEVPANEEEDYNEDDFEQES